MFAPDQAGKQLYIVHTEFPLTVIYNFLISVIPSGR